MNKKITYLFFFLLLSYSDGNNIANTKENTSPFFYMPINVGNYWKYKCSSENESLFEKEIKVIKKLNNNKLTYYQLEFKSDNSKKLKYFIWSNKKGELLSSYNSNLQPSEIIMIKNPSITSKIGKNKVIASEWIKTPATGRIRTIKTKSIPNIKEEHEFEIYFFKNYAKNIGLVSESDSFGGECELIKYKVK